MNDRSRPWKTVPFSRAPVQISGSPEFIFSETQKQAGRMPSALIGSLLDRSVAAAGSKRGGEARRGAAFSGR